MTSIILEKNKVEYEIPKKKKKPLKNSSNLISIAKYLLVNFLGHLKPNFTK